MTNRSRQQIEAEQLSKLRALIDTLVPDNRFYAPILEAAGITPDIKSLEDFRGRMPLTTKQQLVDDQLAYPPYGTNLTYSIERYTRYSQTSGSTAEPMRWLDTAESWQWMIDIWRQVFTAAGVAASDRILFAFSFGPFIGFWLAFEAATQMGCLCLSGGGMSSVARLRMIVDNRVSVLCCTPTYAMHLGQVARDERIDLGAAAVRWLIIAGEPGASIPAVRKRVEAMWPGARAFDHHGMTEIGPVTHEDPARPGVLRVVESEFIAEVIDPDTSVGVGGGDTGELVLTNLGRFGSPLLRYRTGDIVKRTDEEAIALDGGIIGRVDDMVSVRGVNVFPSVIDDIVRSCDGIAEYRVEVRRDTAMIEMSLLIEPTSGRADASAITKRLDDAFRSTLALRVPVRVVDPGTLPRFELKAKRWVYV